MKFKKIFKKYFSKKELYKTPSELYPIDIENKPKNIDNTLDILKKNHNYHDAAKLALSNGLINEILYCAEKMEFDKNSLGMFYDTIRPKLAIQKDLTKKLISSKNPEKTNLRLQKTNWN